MFHRACRQSLRERLCLHEPKIIGRLFAPLLDRLAYDPALRLPQGTTLDFAIKNGAAHKDTGIAGRITDLSPADRFGADSIYADVFLVFSAILPDELAVILALLDVYFEAHRFDDGHTFQHV